MKLKSLMSALAVAAVASLQASSALADPTYVGSWQVDQGPGWTSEPLAYTGQQAAALLFSSITGDSNPNNYAISTRDELVADINFSAWYSILGYGGGTIFAQDYVSPTSTQAPGYYFSGNWNYSSDGTDAVSAFVSDNAGGSQYKNYAFYLGPSVAPVPEPETYAMMLAGLGLLGVAARRRKQKSAT